MIRTISIPRSEIHYDVSHATWRRKKVSGENSQAASAMDMSMDDAEDWMNRAIDSAIGNITGKLEWAYAGDGDEYDGLSDKDTYDIPINVKDGWTSNVHAVRSAMHEYIKEFCLADWYANIDMSLSSHHAQKADVHLRQVLYKVNSYNIKTPTFTL